jgi:hypothetical protein
VQTKIATCSYCGTRAALVLKGETKHELACSACGAPLHDLKQMPSEKHSYSHKAKSKIEADRYGYVPSKKKKSKYKKKKRKSLFSEAFDIIEDIFD